MSVSLPNIKKLFLPDPGYLLLDCDLAGADAQVVAWEANDHELKQAFRAGLDVHSLNASTMMGTRFTSLASDDPKRKKLRQQNKIAVHGTNYGAKPPTLAQILGWTNYEAELFQHRWFSAHPGILEWHRRTDAGLRIHRSVTNAFGYTRTYFDRVDGLLPQALAWTPQSTVALTCFHGALQLEERVPLAQILVQVHDSLVLQIPMERRDLLPAIHAALTNVVPYDDPLTIPWGLSVSARSWGDCKEEAWPLAA